MNETQLERIETYGFLKDIIDAHFPVEFIRLGRRENQPPPELRKNDPEFAKILGEIMDKEL